MPEAPGNSPSASRPSVRATLHGYTQRDLEITFAAHLAGVDWAELRRWHNGYGCLGEPVYNPFDILFYI